MKRPTLTLVIPIFNEEAVIPELERRVKSTFASIGSAIEDWEVVFVDDGSSDASPALLRAMCSAEPRFKLVAFARNFGHQAAITAGLDVAAGESVVIMDADLQDPPEVIAAMVAKWREGWDVVYAVRVNRQGESAFKRATAAIFYRVLRAMLGGFSIPLDTGDFRLIARPVVLAMRALREQHRFVRGMVSWVGFRQTAVHYERRERFAGETKYPLRKMLRFAIDGITSFSIVPLRFATWLGTFAGLVAMVAAAWSVYEKMYGRGVVQGWTTIMLAVALGSSAQLLMIGILGEYIGRIYEEVKRRPLYVAIDRVNLSDSYDP
jgi:polyisoprenyl-phosphate glycosyltransferase